MAILKNKILKSEIEIGKSDGNAKTIIPEYKVTAVIPNYNYARYLQERLDSILFQTYPVAEVIILVDCSKDNSIEVIQKLIEENKSGIGVLLGSFNIGANKNDESKSVAVTSIKFNIPLVLPAEDDGNTQTSHQPIIAYGRNTRNNNW